LSNLGFVKSFVTGAVALPALVTITYCMSSLLKLDVYGCNNSLEGLTSFSAEKAGCPLNNLKLIIKI